MTAPCWLCGDLRGIAIHKQWSERRGTDRPPLWTAHALDTGDDHDVRPCPACALHGESASREQAETEARRWRMRFSTALAEYTALTGRHSAVLDPSEETR